MLKNEVNGTPFEKDRNSILYLGQSTTDEGIYLNATQLKTHMFVSGSTGSGKTEFLTSVMAQAIGWGSGAVFVDGKGDIGFFARLHLIAAALGREQDLLLLNFMKGNVSEGEGFASHTVNPFNILGADELTQLMASMLHDSGSDNMWRDRAISLMSAIINTLVWLRDNNDEPLTISSIRESLDLKNLIRLQERLMTEGCGWDIRRELDFYFKSLPGYQEEKGFKQSQVTLDQHGYLTMQWTRPVGVLATTYGHILNVETPDIDIRDVVLNRRILVILLPSLERSSSDIRNIGSLMVGMIKSMLGQALRTPVEGSWSRVVDERITNATYPFMIIMDEVGQYLTDGMGMLAQQARSMNIGLVFATQDFDSLHFANAKETEAILANTNTKVYLKAENPMATQINRTLQPFENAITKRNMYRDNLQRTRRTVVHDRMMYGRLRTEEQFQQLESFNLEAVVNAENERDFDLPMLLKGFKTGEMLVIHGASCVQGVSNYIPVVGDSEHTIKLARFVHLEGYGDAIKHTAMRPGLGRDIARNISEELTARAREYRFDKLSDFLETACEPRKARAFFPATVENALIKSGNSRQVWVDLLVDRVIRNSSLISDPAITTAYEEMVASLNAPPMEIPVEATVEQAVETFDLLTILTRADQ